MIDSDLELRLLRLNGSSESGGSESKGGAKPSGARTVLMGDSLTLRAGTFKAWPLNGTGTIEKTLDSAFSMLNALTGNPFDVVANAAVGGQRTNEMVERFSADVLSHNPSVVWIQAGTNDINFFQYDSLVTFNNIKTMIEAALSKGAFVIVGSIPPKDGLNSSSALHLMTANAMLANYCRDKADTYFIDCMELTVDNSSITPDWLPNLAADGTHPSSKDALYLMVKNSVEDIKRLFQPVYLVSSGADTFNGAGSPVSENRFPGINILTKDRSFMQNLVGSVSAGTGRTITGKPPPGMVLQGNSGSWTCNVTSAARADGVGDDLIFDFPTITTGGTFILFYQPHVPTYLTVGRYYEVVAEITYTNSPGIRRVMAQIRAQVGGSSLVSDMGDYGTPSSQFPTDGTFIIKTPRYLYSAGETIRVSFFFGLLASSGLNIRIGRLSMREYDEASYVG